MKALAWTLGLGIGLLVLAAPGASLAQANPPVSQVIYFDVNNNLPGFVALVQKAQGIRAELGVPGKVRLFQATIAGDDTGAVAVVIEYADFVTLAQAGAKLAASEKWQALVAEAQAGGFQPTNGSVFTEIGP